MLPKSDSGTMKLLHHTDELPDAGCPNQGFADLTPCEWTLLLYIADDLANAEIAEKLYVTQKSVENYRTRIGAKLNLRGCHKLAKFARKYAIQIRQQHEELLRKLPPRNKPTSD